MKHQDVMELCSCPSFQYEQTSLFLAWTVQLVCMSSMSMVAQQNRQSTLSCGHFQPNRDFRQQCYEAENLQI